MSSIDEQILRASKEIVVKFIETGRVSPNAFPELFKTVYGTIENTVKPDQTPEETTPKQNGK
jgi:predicted transcriptional regulator